MTRTHAIIFGILALLALLVGGYHYNNYRTQEKLNELGRCESELNMTFLSNESLTAFSVDNGATFRRRAHEICVARGSL